MKNRRRETPDRTHRGSIRTRDEIERWLTARVVTRPKLSSLCLRVRTRPTDTRNVRSRLSSARRLLGKFRNCFVPFRRVTDHRRVIQPS